MILLPNRASYSAILSFSADTAAIGTNSADPKIVHRFLIVSFLSNGIWDEGVCKVSGLLSSSACPDTCGIYRPECAWKTEKCTRHRNVWIDSIAGYEVCSRCWNEETRTNETCVIYPPPVTEILRRKGKSVRGIPPHNPSCTAVRSRRSSITIEYPVEGITIFAPRDFSGTTQKIVAKAACSGLGPLYWYLDGKYIIETREDHSTALRCAAGRHVLTVVDTEGGEEQVGFRVSTMSIEQ